MVAGYQKALKMIKTNLPLLNKPSKFKKKIDKKLLKNLEKDTKKLIKKFNATLLHKCEDFKYFTGRDIDTLFNKKQFFYRSKENLIIRNLSNQSYRVHLNHIKNKEFLNLDIENYSDMPEVIKKVFVQNFDNKIYCKKTKLNHFSLKSIIFYKLIKYFYNGSIHSFDQLKYLKKDITKLNENELKLLKKLIEKTMPNEKIIIENFLYFNFEKFYKNNLTKKFFSEKRLVRHNKRVIFSGKLYLDKIFFSKKFVYAFLFGASAKWKFNHNPMPAISIVGNDGSGKTTLVEYIRKNFSKMDPLIFDMKASVPFFSIILKIRKTFKRIKNLALVKKIYFLNSFISIIGELIDLFDKYVKFKIGMAWADAGYGLTIFERFPTDRVRGEFPNERNKLFPLEQFFPFPDGMVYLDVRPKDSIIRKKNDKHTLIEMKSKRKNYLSLIKEFDEVEFLSPSRNLNDKILKIKNYIFKLNLKKKNQIKLKGKVKRLYWKKNFNRVLAGNNLNKSQKDGYFG